MTAEPAARKVPEPEPADHAQASAGNPWAELSMLWHELRGLAHDHLQLAGLEARRAGQSLVDMIAAGVFAGMLLSSGWLGIMAAVVLKLVDDGLSGSDAILLAVAVNLMIALIFVGAIRRKSRFLLFPGTLRSLRSESSERQDTGEA